MRVSVFNKKGGVGKTPISVSLAKDLECYLLSNDDSVIEDVLPDQAKILEKLQLIDNCIYDFGGFVDAGVIDIIKHSDLVVVPCFNDIDALKRTIKTIGEINAIAKKILVVATRTEKEEDLAHISESVKKFFPDIDVMELKKSRIFSTVVETGMSVNEIVNDNPLSRFAYRNIATQYNDILNYVKGAAK